MMRTTNGLLVLLASLLLLPAHTARADTDLRYNQVHLQAQQSESVSNDTMHVSLSTYGEARDPASLAMQLNTDMEWALAIARQNEGVTVSTGGYQTYPVHRDNVLKGWRGQQSLELEGKDTRQIGELAGQLQEKLQIKSINFSVSGEKRHAVENRLIDRALEAFKQRARIVGDNLKASGYRIVDINISTSAQRPPVPYQARMMAAPMEAAAAVAVEAGESDIVVSVNGTVELQLP
jgi:predicted secreted protein